jgi:hypothetical protein
MSNPLQQTAGRVTRLNTLTLTGTEPLMESQVIAIPSYSTSTRQSRGRVSLGMRERNNLGGGGRFATDICP